MRILVSVVMIGLAGCMPDDGVRVDNTANFSDADKVAMAKRTEVIGAEDGQKIYADYAPVENARAIIVLFHQAGSSAYEYADIAPRLNAAGYSTLAVDARSGGSMYGPNRTVEKYPGVGENYLAALPDLEAALNWAKVQGKPVILWGSSYSSSLALKLAGDNPDLVAAVLAFSPGEYFDDKSLIRSAAARIKAPVFITDDGTSGEQTESKAIFDAIPGSNKVFIAPAISGVHGSSTLLAKRNPKGAEANWEPVMAFLKGLKL